MKKLSRSQRRNENAWQFLLIVAASAAVIVIGLVLLQQNNLFRSSVKSAGSGVPVEVVSDEGVTWLPEPQEIKEDLKLFTLESEVATFNPDAPAPKIRYYKLGSDHGQDIIVAIAPAIDPGGERHIVLLNKGEIYHLIPAYSQDVFNTATNEYVGPDPTKATNLNYPSGFYPTYHSMSPPKDLIVRGGQLTQVGSSYGIFNYYFFSDYLSPKSTDGGTVTKFAETPWGTLYSYIFIQKDDNGKQTKIQKFILKLANGLAVSYQSHPQFVADDNIPLITWKDGTKNGDTFAWDSLGGCGAPSYVVVLDGAVEQDLVPTGKTVTGETVYGFRDPTHSVVKDYYAQLPDGKYYTYDQKTGENKQIPISLQEYANKHGIFVYKDMFGRFIIFSNNTIGTGAECGKPVIYLYPEKTTAVTVTVGASITTSEPVYGSGWQVTAEPNGQLTTTDGSRYSSLFWEGLGHGFYPEVSSGFIVARAQVEKTLRAQVTKLGLNATESRDFLAFWLPKMPTTPYVRLTWFGTRQMDELAPLTILPKPDTVIRLFLDYAGLEKPVILPTQTLSSIPRHGFTVVEWGGLLRGNQGK